MVAAGVARESGDEARKGTLAGTWLDYAAVAVVVLSIFFQRLDQDLYLYRGLPIPDATFDVAIAVLSLRYLHELVRRNLRLARPTRRELTVAGSVVLLPVLGVVSLLSEPSWMPSVFQIAKSSSHIIFLAYAAILIGRSVSKELLDFALKLYFFLASAAGALAIVQAVDLNAGSGFLTRHLHLIFRAHPGYEAPCSIYSEPAVLGYISIAALVVGLLHWQSIGKRRAIAGSALCALALFLAFPAGPALCIVVLGLVLVIERRPKLSLRAWGGAGALAAVLVAIGLASPVGPALYHRASGIVTGSDASARYRSALDADAIRIWRIAPLTGVGLGDTRRLHTIRTPFDQTHSFIDTNGYLSLLAETGVFGLAAMVVLLAAFLWPGTRPVRFATVTQLNVLDVAVSLFVAGTFLLPLLWFWGGLRLATVRAGGPPDLYETSLAALRQRLLPPGGRALPSGQALRTSRRLRPVLLALAVAALTAAGYGLEAQRATSASKILVSNDGVTQMSERARPGDAQLARADWQAWGECGAGCQARFHYLGGRLWRIHAEWPSGGTCLLLDLASFRKSGGSTRRALLSGSSGLTLIPCT